MSSPRFSRVLFVCTGNICRSPAAHAVVEAALGRAGRGDVVVDSAGTGDWHAGELPDARARAEGARRGLALTHPARRVVAADFAAGTLVVAMDQGHHRAVARMAPGFADLVLFRDFDPARSGPADVEDPYYGGSDGFADMFDVIERCVPALLARIG